MDRAWESWLALLVMIGSGIGLVALVTLFSVPILVTLAFDEGRSRAVRARLGRVLRDSRDKGLPASATH